MRLRPCRGSDRTGWRRGMGGEGRSRRSPSGSRAGRCSRSSDTGGDDGRGACLDPCGAARGGAVDPARSVAGHRRGHGDRACEQERKNFLKLLTDRGDLFKPVGQRSPPPPLILRVVIGGGRPDHAENPAEGLAKGKGEECPTR